MRPDIIKIYGYHNWVNYCEDMMVSSQFYMVSLSSEYLPNNIEKNCAGVWM